MNIAEILKDCPKGTRLYSPAFGDVYFQRVRNEDLIEVTSDCDVSYEFFSNGSCSLKGECVLFPSKEQRDWSKFGVSDQVTDQETKHQFKPFDKVLVRINDKCDWVCNIFSHMDSDNEYVCLYMRWPLCIPYEGNENLLGTNNKPE